MLCDLLIQRTTQSVFPFRPVSPGVQTQLTKLGGKHVYLLGHLIGLVFV